jgi:fluoroquinolone transport system permease protein
MEFAAYAGYEVRKWFRDSFTSFMLLFFFMFGSVGRFLVPAIESQWSLNLIPYYHVILAGLVLVAARIAGAVAGFSILDDRDDNIMLAVKVAPMSLEAFIGLKMAMVSLLSFAGGVFVLWFSQLLPLTWDTIIGVAAVSALGAPLAAMQINCLASNKIEGFAMIKGLNILVAVPIVALFQHGAREFLFAFEPGFWPAKALAVATRGPAAGQLSFGAYLLIGLVYAIAVNLALYQVFRRRV